MNYSIRFILAFIIFVLRSALAHNSYSLFFTPYRFLKDLGTDEWIGYIEKHFTKSAESYDAPQSARNNAKKVLGWKEKYGKECKGMTAVGWARARDLAGNAMLSADTVKRMSQFNRHGSNYEKALREKLDDPR